jgi:hypothetical protein
MQRRFWFDLVPSLLIGLGIIAATLIAKRAADSGWLVLLAPLALSLTVVGADMLNSWLRGEPVRPSVGALLLGAAFLLAGGIVAARKPSLVATMIAVSGASAWVTLLLSPGQRRRACNGA